MLPFLARVLATQSEQSHNSVTAPKSTPETVAVVQACYSESRCVLNEVALDTNYEAGERIRLNVK